MAVDSTSPITPARVQVLLLPIRPISHDRFLAFFERLAKEEYVRLSDVTPDTTATSFSPLAFPRGRILYNFTTSLPSSCHTALSPFETFREPFLVIGVGDGAEYITQHALDSSRQNEDMASVHDLTADLEDAVKETRVQLPRVLAFVPLLIDCAMPPNLGSLPPDTIVVPQLERPTTMRTVTADLSSIFLRELSSLARSIQVAPPLDLLYNATHGLSTIQFPLSGPAGVPLRTTSLNPRSFSSPPPSFPEEEPDTNSDKASSTMGSPARPVKPEVLQAQSRVDSPASFATSGRPSHRRESAGSGFASPSPRTSESTVRGLDEQKRVNRVSQTSAGDLGGSRLRARQAIVIGSYYLHAGRWPDAVTQLVEGATKAKAFNDHLWHGKALENLLVTMLLLAWSGFEFRIPQICMAVSSRASSSKRTSSSVAAQVDIKQSQDRSNTDMFHQLSTIIPELTVMIANTYSRAANAQGELPFQFAFSESIIRLARLQTVQYLAGGHLDNAMVQQLVRGTSYAQYSPKPARASDSAFHKHIMEYLQRAYPTKNNLLDFPVAGNIVVLSGLSSVLASVGLKRKEAFINRQLLSVLANALAKAQRSTAPLSSSGQSIEVALQDMNMELPSIFRFLQHVCSEYGIHERQADASMANDPLQDSGFVQAIITEITNTYISQLFISQYMKVSILHFCIAATEALTAPAQMRRFVAAIFAVVRPEFNPATGIMHVTYRLRREEQLDFADKLYRINTAGPEDSVSTKPTFWDPYLLRGVELQISSTANALHSRLKADFLGGSALAERSGSISGPFLHNAFSKTATNTIEKRTIAAFDKAEFVLSLQNLFEFELVVEALTLLTDGVDFEQHSFSVTVGPTRVQRVILSGVPLGAGELRIRGCKATIKGCREGVFLLFPKMWQPKLDSKIGSYRSSSQASLALEQGDPSATVQEPIKPVAEVSTTLPADSSISITIIERQPILRIVSTTLTQSALTLLEGEVLFFTVTIKNESLTTSIDFLHTSLIPTFETPETTPLIWPSLFELCDENDGTQITMAPEATRALPLRLTGMAGLVGGTLVIDYAHLGKPFDDVKKTFYTRQLSIPLQMTVTPSLRLTSVDVQSDSANDTALLQLTFRNLSTALLRANLATMSTNSKPRSGESQSHQVIAPNQITRFIVPFQKLSRADLTKRIPGAPGHGRRQTHIAKSASDEETLITAAFWLKEALIERIRCTWDDPERHIGGSVNLDTATFTSEVISRLRAAALKVTLQAANGLDTLSKDLHMTTNTMLVLELNIENRLEEVLFPHINLTAKFTNSSGEHIGDMTQHVAWAGACDRPCRRLLADESTRVALAVCFLTPGVYEVDALVTQEVNDGVYGSSEKLGFSQISVVVEHG